VLLFLADQISKWALYDQARWEEHLLLHPVFNTGIGRSIPVPVSAVLLLSTGIVAGIRWARSRKELSTTVTLLFLAGALGNMRDRFFLGWVRDFIDLQYRPIFNLADVFLTCGVLLLLWETWKK
jgi:lipoprotein signal peptidase